MNYRIIDEYGVKGMFTAPTALRAIKRLDPYNVQAKNYSRKTYVGQKTVLKSRQESTNLGIN
jgi:acyl-coenzyme A synthetase/AMP-(fatty) acid ligase